MTAANSPEEWNRLWLAEGQDSWRKDALAHVYTRITRLIPKGSRVADFGGGVGLLAQRLRDEVDCNVRIFEHNEEALRQAQSAGITAEKYDLEGNKSPVLKPGEIVIATEVVEHLSGQARDAIFREAAEQGRAFFSVPNDRLGPEEEPQHTIKFTAKSFLDELHLYFKDVRVECLGPIQPETKAPAFLLAICGFPKPFTLALTMPVRDEADDIALTLASFRGVADEIVIGIDPRSSDGTRDIVAKYADVVFDLTELRGPPGQEVPEGGIHFAHARNQCMARCKAEWIFMTEGHERLNAGDDVLLSLDKLPPGVKIGLVKRQDGGQEWAFPWLCRNHPQIRYLRGTHNVLDWPDGFLVVKLPQVQTLHKRSKENEIERQKQRAVQNRRTLMDDWTINKNNNSLYYLAQEWREYDGDRAIERMREYLAVSRENGPMRYATKLTLAKMLSERARPYEARNILLSATEDDWSRIEHWVFAGDIVFQLGEQADERGEDMAAESLYEQAKQFYTYATARTGEAPFSLWWVDQNMYSYLPAQRLAMVFGALGRHEDALHWASRVIELLPDSAPAALFEEATSNKKIIEEHIHERANL